MVKPLQSSLPQELLLAVQSYCASIGISSYKVAQKAEACLTPLTTQHSPAGILRQSLSQRVDLVTRRSGIVLKTFKLILDLGQIFQLGDQILILSFKLLSSNVRFLQVFYFDFHCRQIL